MAKKKATKANWVVVGARIPPELRQRIVEKHNNPGEISELILVLLQKYIEGKIFGVKVVVQN